jgi:2-dehydro-3-deoxyphosphogluconate aldolase/(4S)-4-hydroxy-2-oxoglutarate aldolase
MRDASVVAVLRGKNEDRLVARGLELAQCGCRCIEVTLDSNGALGVLRRLREQLPSSVLLGAATVMDARQASDAISAGAKFITSPIAAVELMRVCQEAGEFLF